MISSNDHARSAALQDEALRYIPGGVNSCRRKSDPPVCWRRGEGAYVEDVDGHRYLDFHAAWGAVLLGHSYPEVVERVSDAIRSRVLFGSGVTEGEVELAQRIVEHVPSVEQVLLCNSGTEATMHAVRVARAFTGRQKILKLQGCYHGGHDYVLRNHLSTAERVGKRDPHSAGMLDAAVDSTVVSRFNDADDVERTLAAHPEQIAAVIVEPISHNSPGILPKPGFLADLRSLCDREGSLLIFDEIITGFRHHIGGYQAIAGVFPDLTAMGKGLGNGFPISAVGGRWEVMQRYNTSPEGDVHFGGTYNGGCVGVEAALATLSVLEREPVHAHTSRLGDRMRKGLEVIARDAGVPAVASGYGSIFWLSFMEGELTSYEDVLRVDSALAIRYRQALVARGVFEMPDSPSRSHISYSHTEADIDRALEIAEDALNAALRTRRPAPSAT